MPDILYVPKSATKNEIVDCIDRCQLGDLLVLDGRVISLVAHSVDTISGSKKSAADRRLFGAIDAIIHSAELPIDTPETAARYLVETGVAQDRNPEHVSQRIAKHYRQNRRIVRKGP